MTSMNARPVRGGTIRRAWRGLVRTFGRLPDYLVGPAPWEARNVEAKPADAGEDDAGSLPAIRPSPEPGWPGGVEVIRLKNRPRTLTGAH